MTLDQAHEQNNEMSKASYLYAYIMHEKGVAPYIVAQPSLVI